MSDEHRARRAGARRADPAPGGAGVRGPRARRSPRVEPTATRRRGAPVGADASRSPSRRPDAAARSPARRSGEPQPLARREQPYDPAPRTVPAASSAARADGAGSPARPRPGRPLRSRPLRPPRLRASPARARRLAALVWPAVAAARARRRHPRRPRRRRPAGRARLERGTVDDGLDGVRTQSAAPLDADNGSVPAVAQALLPSTVQIVAEYDGEAAGATGSGSSWTARATS